MKVYPNNMVSGRELHVSLKSNADFSTWMRKKIADADLQEDRDFSTFKGKSTGGRPTVDYQLTIEAAKEICLLQQTPEGHKIRRELIEVSRKVEDKELLNEEQILFLVKLKEVFKYVCYQKDIEEKHKVTFVEQSNKKNAYAEFNVWRNSMLNLEPAILEERIKAYCVEHSKKVTVGTKRDKLLILDKYETIRNAVWDFLQLKGEVNSMRLANLVKKMAEAEGAQLFRTNEDDLFRQKEQLHLPSILQKQLK